MRKQNFVSIPNLLCSKKFLKNLHVFFSFSDKSKELKCHLTVLKKASSKITAEIRMLKTRISNSEENKVSLARIENSEDHLSPAQIANTHQEIADLLKVVETKRESLQKSESLDTEIANLRQVILTVEEKDEIKAQIKEAADGLKSLLEPLQLIPNTSAEQLASVLQVQENACRELECVVCIEVPQHPIQIFSCSNHHLLCTKCKNNPVISKCPVCKQNFAKTPAKRNRLAEKMIEMLT